MYGQLGVLGGAGRFFAPLAVPVSWDPAFNGGFVLSNNNDTAAAAPGGFVAVLATRSFLVDGATPQTRYFEIVVDVKAPADDALRIGISNAALNLHDYVGVGPGGWGYGSQTIAGSGFAGPVYNSGFTGILRGPGLVAGDVFGCAIDSVATSYTFYVNGAVIGGITPTQANLNAFGAQNIFPAASIQNGASQVTLRTSPAELSFLPAGYSAWGTP